MGTFRHYHRLMSLIAGTLTLITAAIASPKIASAQTRIISVSGNLDFGRVPLHSSSQKILTISNTGDSVLTVTGFGYPVLPVSTLIDFQASWTGPIAPGGSQDVAITFTPLGSSILGTNDVGFQGYLAVLSDATDGTNYIATSGVGTWPSVSTLPAKTNLNFGTLPINNLAGRGVFVTNTGNTPVTISNISFPEGFSSDPGTFPTFISGTIAPGTATNINVLFHPTTPTNYGGLVIITSDATEPTLVVLAPGDNITNSPLGISQFSVAGTGVYPTGKFIGIFTNENPTFDNSGYFVANCSAKGKFRATVTIGGKRYPFSAQASPTGFVSGTIKRKKLPNLNISLHFGGDFTAGWLGTIGDGTWTEELSTWPSHLLTKNSLHLLPAGKFTLTIAGSTDALIGPTAPGTGDLEIKLSGIIHLKGTLGDGTRYSENTIAGSRIPFYAPLYGHRGAVFGWIDPQFVFTLPPVTLPPIGIHPAPQAVPSADPYRQFAGTLTWFKPAGIDLDYPDGFSFQTKVTGPIP